MEKRIIKYFFDTYAVVEILNGNPNYAKYVQEEVTITQFNLAEIYWNALLEYTDFQANIIYEKYKQSVINVNDETLKEAIKFRKGHKRQDLSCTDCIGYTCALKNGLLFLTGDKEFANLPNVEFVK
jgi:predicted nucleic acid-binding protein